MSYALTRGVLAFIGDLTQDFMLLFAFYVEIILIWVTSCKS